MCVRETLRKRESLWLFVCVRVSGLSLSRTHTFSPPHPSSVFLCLFVCVCVWVHVFWRACVREWGVNLFRYAHACAYVRVFVRLRTCVCVCVCLNVCVCVCVSACCVCVGMWMREWNCERACRHNTTCAGVFVTFESKA